MNRGLHVLLLLVVVLSPLPLGSNREWSWSLCALLTGLLALVWGLSALARPGRVPVQSLQGPVLLFVAVCGWVAFQASPWAPDSWHHPLWQQTATLLEQPVAGTITLAPEDSLTALMRLVCYGLVFFLAFQLGAERDRAAAAFKWLGGAGLLYAVFGLITYWGQLENRLWFSPEGANLAVRGPFVNRNSFATYLGLCMLCALALMHRALTLRRNPLYSLPGGRAQTIEQFILRACRPLAGLLLMAAALILAQSRAGFASFILGALTLWAAVHSRRAFTSRRMVAAVAVALITLVGAFLMTGELLLKRLDRLHLDTPARLEVYRLAAGASDDNPWLGFGYGTFADSFRLYRDDALRAHFDMAHNTWLENLFELGWPAAGLLFLAIGWVALMCWRGLRRRRHDWIYPAAGLAATALVALHSLFDFSLQMPAVAMTYACLLGTACAQSFSRTDRRRGP